MAEPRILFVNRLAPYTTGGARKVIWALGNAMAVLGWDVHYWCPDPGFPPPLRENISFHLMSAPRDDIRASYHFISRGIPMYLRLVSQLKPDIIYDNCSPVPFVPAYFLHSRRIITRIHHIYAGDAFRYKRGLLNPVVTFLGEQWFRTLDGRKIVADSQSTKQRLQMLVRHRDEVNIISPGIDLSGIPRPGAPRLRNSHIVLALSRLATNKGLNHLLRAWSLVESSDDLAHLKIAGTGREESNLKRLAEELKLRRVEFLGFVSDDVKWSLLEECSVFAFPTLIEGLPIGLLEAMAMGAPIVSTDTWGVRDLVKHEETGYVVPVSDADRLAVGLLDMLGNPAKASQMAEEASRQVEAHDLARVNQEEIELLQSIMQR